MKGHGENMAAGRMAPHIRTSGTCAYPYEHQTRNKHTPGTQQTHSSSNAQHSTSFCTATPQHALHSDRGRVRPGDRRRRLPAAARTPKLPLRRAPGPPAHGGHARRPLRPLLGRGPRGRRRGRRRPRGTGRAPRPHHHRPGAAGWPVTRCRYSSHPLPPLFPEAIAAAPRRSAAAAWRPR